jgi:hypothetical protein
MPTNNTETAASGFDRHDDPTRATMLLAFVQPPTAVWEDKRDGQWLSERSAPAQSAIDGVEHAAGRDQIVGRAMGTASPATLGYMLETLMHPIFRRHRRRTPLVSQPFRQRTGLGACRSHRQAAVRHLADERCRWRWVTDPPQSAAGAGSVACREATSRCCARFGSSRPTGRS